MKDTLKSVLNDIREKLANSLYECEEHIRLSLVLRVLYELGWDIWNPCEVNAEYKPVPTEDKKKVDIALFQTKYVPTAYIEIKQHGTLTKGFRALKDSSETIVEITLHRFQSLQMEKSGVSTIRKLVANSRISSLKSWI